MVVGVQGPGTNGQVVAYAPNGSVRWRVTDAASYHDVTILANGHVLAAYAEGSQACGRFPAPCARTGYKVIDPDPEPHVVEQWSFPVRTMGNSEVHDVEVLPDGDLVIVDMDRERVFRLDRETWEIEWEWHASSHYDPPADPTRTDWLHMNDVDRLGEGRYLVSVRNANQLVVISREGVVLEVVNRHGSPTILRGQHNPHWLGDGRVLVGDSSNDRVVELAKHDGSWRPVWSVERAGGQPFAWPRDADRLPNGHTLITDSRNHRLVEVDAQGRVVGSIRTTKLPYEADMADGEQDDVPVASSAEGVDDGTGEDHWPVVGQVYLALHHGVGLPYWVTDPVIAAWIAGLTLQLVVAQYWAVGELRRWWTRG